MIKKIEDLTIKEILQYCNSQKDEFCLQCRLLFPFGNSCYHLKNDKTLKMHLDMEVDLEDDKEIKIHD